MLAFSFTALDKVLDHRFFGFKFHTYFFIFLTPGPLQPRLFSNLLKNLRNSLDLEFLAILTLSPDCWNCRCLLPYLPHFIFLVKFINNFTLFGHQLW